MKMKLFVALNILCLALCLTGCSKTFSDQIVEAIEEQKIDTGFISISEIIDFKWDTMYIFEGLRSEEITEIIGLNYSKSPYLSRVILFKLNNTILEVF